jgi:tetratricopeptide (TPR) repeat protein
MLARLAAIYVEQGKFERAIQTYRRLISEDPQSASNPGHQLAIIDAYEKIGDDQAAYAEVDRLLDTYGRTGAWARANAANVDAVAEAEAALEKNLRRIAIRYHSRAKKLATGPAARRTYALAREAYTTYVAQFSDSAHIYDVRYAFGELLYKTRAYAEAYEQYMAVVALDPKGRHSRFCAESAIFAAEKVVEAQPEASRGAGDGTAARDLSEWDTRLLAACDQFAGLYEDDAKVRSVIYKSAYLLYNRFRFEEAAVQFKRVISLDPGSRQAEQAANLILDSFVVTEDWANLEETARFMYAQEGLGSASFKREVYGVVQRAAFKVIETNLARDGDKERAADGYMAFYEEFEATADTGVLATALNNASVYLRDARRGEDELRVRLILIDDPRFGANTPYYVDQVAAVGFLYESVADFAKAADYYEQLFGLLGETGTRAADAIYWAAVFRRATADGDAAVADYERFVAAAPQDERVPDASITIGLIHEEQGQWAQAARAYSAASKRNGLSPDLYYFARLHEADALGALGQEDKRRQMYGRTVAEYRRFVAQGGDPGEHTEVAAEMMFALAQTTFDEFAQREIRSLGTGARQKAEDAHMKKQVRDKQQGFGQVAAVYAEVIQTGSGEWGLAAMVALGKAQENLAQTLLDGDVPSFLNAEQAEAYRTLMTDIAYLRIDEAVQLYAGALDQAYGLTLYNDDTAYAARRLGELRPADYPRLEEEVPAAGFTASGIPATGYEATP